MKTERDICKRIVELESKLNIIRKSINDSKNNPNLLLSQENEWNAFHYFQGEIASLYWMLGNSEELVL